MKTKIQPSENTKKILKNLKALSSKLFICAFLTAIFMLAAFFIPGNVTYEYQDVQETANKDASTETDASSTLRLLREKNGKIGVFRTDGSLVRIIDVEVSLLPEYDKELLSEGIVAEEDELYELIESLTS